MKRGILYLLLLIVTAGCSEHTDDIIPVVPADQVRLVFSPESVRMATRAEADEPADINNLEVLAFEKIKDDTFTYTYRTTAEVAGSEGKYKVTLRLSDVPVKLLLIANHTDFEKIAFGCKIAEATDSLWIPFTPAGIEQIPMYGEIDFEKGITSSDADRVQIKEDIPLLRSVAMVDISIGNDLGSKDIFILKSIQAYRANNRIQLIPDESALAQREEGKEWKVVAPSVLEGTENIITTPSEKVLEPIFLPESEERKGDAVTTEATCLIVGGIYQGSGYETNTNISYYRIDFKSKDENDNEITGQILRNHKYNIVITDVNGPGTTHPEEADGSNLQTTVIGWSNGGGDIILE